MAQKQIEERMDGTEREMGEIKETLQSMGKSIERLTVWVIENQRAMANMFDKFIQWEVR